MAVRLPEPGLYLDGADCARLGPLLGRYLAEQARRDGGVPPRLADLVLSIQETARRYRHDTIAGSATGTDQFRNEADGASFVASADRLTVEEAARLLGVSTSYVRRLLRQRELEGSRAGGRGAWSVDMNAVLERLEDARRTKDTPWLRQSPSAWSTSMAS